LPGPCTQCSRAPWNLGRHVGERSGEAFWGPVHALSSTTIRPTAFWPDPSDSGAKMPAGECRQRLMAPVGGRATPSSAPHRSLVVLLKAAGAGRKRASSKTGTTASSPRGLNGAHPAEATGAHWLDHVAASASDRAETIYREVLGMELLASRDCPTTITRANGQCLPVIKGDVTSRSARRRRARHPASPTLMRTCSMYSVPNRPGHQNLAAPGRSTPAHRRGLHRTGPELTRCPDH
jgi:hypothetical protein